MLASVKTLLSSIVDYAGLFPPAKLSMSEALAIYAQSQMSPYNWMLGRFVIPASRLDELEELLPTLPLKQWPLSVILSGDLDFWVRTSLPQGASLAPCLCAGELLHNTNQTTITALEIFPLPPVEIEKVFPRLPLEVDSFFEIPLKGDIDAYLSTLQGAGTSAKIRTGGITADAFPSVTQLCQFIIACAQAQIPFKATAGLHHPLPGNHRLTYEADSPSTVMHGFLNVAILAALVYWQKVTPQEALKLLQEDSLENFQFKDDGIGWRECYLTLAEIEEVRQRFFRSFGSCSFQEPIDDLKELKLL